jgi:hypothetical protein
MWAVVPTGGSDTRPSPPYRAARPLILPAAAQRPPVPTARRSETLLPVVAFLARRPGNLDVVSTPFVVM